jgi:hypothetical protein
MEFPVSLALQKSSKEVSVKCHRLGNFSSRSWYDVCLFGACPMALAAKSFERPLQDSSCLRAGPTFKSPCSHAGRPHSGHLSNPATGVPTRIGHRVSAGRDRDGSGTDYVSTVWQYIIDIMSVPRGTDIAMHRQCSSESLCLPWAATATMSPVQRWDGHAREATDWNELRRV